MIGSTVRGCTVRGCTVRDASRKKGRERQKERQREAYEQKDRGCETETDMISRAFPSAQSPSYLRVVRAYGPCCCLHRLFQTLAVAGLNCISDRSGVPRLDSFASRVSLTLGHSR